MDIYSTQYSICISPHSFPRKITADEIYGPRSPSCSWMLLIRVFPWGYPLSLDGLFAGKSIHGWFWGIVPPFSESSNTNQLTAGDYPLVNKHSYWKWSFIVDSPINSMVDLSSSLCKRLPEGNHLLFCSLVSESMIPWWNHLFVNHRGRNEGLETRGADHISSCFLMTSHLFSVNCWWNYI